MIIKRILSWTVCMVICGVAAVPAARAEQPIIIPLILVVDKGAGQVNSMDNPKVQTALYRSQDVGTQSRAADQNFPETTRTAAAAGNVVRSGNCGAFVVRIRAGKHDQPNRSGTAELSLPVVVKVVINGGAATDVSVVHPSDLPRTQATKEQGPIIPAVDLLTGEPTTVRPEYIQEYQQIVRAGRK